MDSPKLMRQKVPFWVDGQLLAALAFVLSGTIIAGNGILRLRELWHQFQPIFPLALPGDVSQVILNSFPLILNTLINVVASACAVLMGCAWIFSGLIDTFRSFRNQIIPRDFEQPELAVEILRSARPAYWRNFSLLARVLARIRPQLRFMSPVTHEMFCDLVRGVTKIALLGILITIIVHFLDLIPRLIKNYFQLQINLSVPSAGPLYYLLILVIFAYIVMACSLIPFRELHYFRSSRTIQVRGTGHPLLFLALFEEACGLLNPPGFPAMRPIRLEQVGGRAKGTLIESFPRVVHSIPGRAGYACLPIMVLSLTIGFWGLIRFQHPAVIHEGVGQFLALNGLEYVGKISFFLGLILSGTYFAVWAERLLSIRMFRSALVFCSSTPTQNSTETEFALRTEDRYSGESVELKWKIQGEVDAEFTSWAIEPHNPTRFSVEIFFAEAFSESGGQDGPRFLMDLHLSESLDTALKSILDLPFCLRFERILPEELSRGELEETPEYTIQKPPQVDTRGQL